MLGDGMTKQIFSILAHFRLLAVVETNQVYPCAMKAIRDRSVEYAIEDIS